MKKGLHPFPVLISMSRSVLHYMLATPRREHSRTSTDFSTGSSRAFLLLIRHLQNAGPWRLSALHFQKLRVQSETMINSTLNQQGKLGAGQHLEFSSQNLITQDTIDGLWKVKLARLMAQKEGEPLLMTNLYLSCSWALKYFRLDPSRLPVLWFPVFPQHCTTYYLILPRFWRNTT